MRGSGGKTIAAACLLTAVVPAGAGAATISSQPSPRPYLQVTVRANPGEVNDVTVRSTGDGRTTIRDAGPLLLPNFLAFTGCQWRLVDVVCSPVNEVRLELGDGADRAIVDRFRSTTRVAGGPGDDVLLGGDGAEMFDGGPGADTFHGGGSPGDLVSDVMDYRARGVPLTVTKDGAANDGAAGEGDMVGQDVELVHGGSADDVLVGHAGPDVLLGGPGDDVVRGLDGQDVLRGDDGDDQLFGGDGRDYLHDGYGVDVAHTGAGDDQLWGFHLDGVVDDFSCGDGDADLAQIFEPDALPADCEIDHP